MTDVNELKARVIAEIDRLRPEAESLASEIHGYAECGWDTPRSAGALTTYLEKHGMAVERGLAGLSSSFRASIPGRASQHPGIALLAEYDALPGLGHGCGHNLIGTVAATAGIALSKVLGDVPGNVYVMGTPFEEGGGGKIVMIEKGVFDVADASIMFHGGNEINVSNPNIAAVGITYKFHGKSAHAGANPHLGINAADAAMLTFAGINALRQHVRSDCRIHGVIKQGGDAPNIVPDYAEVEMLARAKDQAYLLQLVERLHNCARGGALAAGATVEIEQGLVFAEQLTLNSYREIAKANLAALGLPVPTTVKQSFASADSGNVSYAMPHLTFGLPLDDKGSSPHTPAFVTAANSDTGRKALTLAAKIMATTAIDLLTDPAKLAAIKEEHKVVLAAATSQG